MLHRASAVAFVLIVLGASATACGEDSSHVLDLGDGGRTPDAATTTTTTDETDAATTIPTVPTDAGTTVEEHEGKATYYDANGTGACGFKASTDFYVVAMNGTDYDKDRCGDCIDVTGPKGSVVVRITDKCPGCGAGGLDLSITAFTKIGDKSAGRIPVSWHYVACP